MNEIIHLEDDENRGFTICGEILNINTISSNEIICTCEKCLNALIYINFGNMVLREMGISCQYASRYVNGTIKGWENLGKGLRFKGNTNNYHFLKIHKDDVNEFVKRYKEYVKNK